MRPGPKEGESSEEQIGGTDRGRLIQSRREVEIIEVARKVEIIEVEREVESIELEE